jgi:predicted Holliday junction resolvase-like endonuclease
LFAKLFFHQRVGSARKQAVKQSKAVTFGYVSESLAPLAPEFPYHVKDLMFLGKGVDYLVFDGLHEGNLRKIRFLEIKTNSSQLNHREKMIKEAVEKGRVSYEVLRISKRATGD